MFSFALITIGALYLLAGGGAAGPSRQIRYKATNEKPGGGTTDFWQVWIDDGEDQFPLKWEGTDEFPSMAAANAAAIAYIKSVGGTPVAA